MGWDKQWCGPGGTESRCREAPGVRCTRPRRFCPQTTSKRSRRAGHQAVPAPVLVTPMRCRLAVRLRRRSLLISLANTMPLLRISAATYVVLPPGGR